jgi:hypothetical protein
MRLRKKKTDWYCNLETKAVNETKVVNKNLIRVPDIQEDRGIKRIVNQMGSEDLVVERERREKGCSKANRSLNSGGSKTKNITGTDR